MHSLSNLKCNKLPRISVRYLQAIAVSGRDNPCIVDETAATHMNIPSMVLHLQWYHPRPTVTVGHLSSYNPLKGRLSTSRNELFCRLNCTLNNNNNTVTCFIRTIDSAGYTDPSLMISYGTNSHRLDIFTVSVEKQLTPLFFCSFLWLVLALQLFSRFFVLFLKSSFSLLMLYHRSD